MSSVFWFMIALMTFAACTSVAWPLFKHKQNKSSLSLRMTMLSLPLFALLIYFLLGSSQQLQQFWRWKHQEVQVQQQMAQIKNPQQIIERMREHLRQSPNSTEGWYLLGKLYLDQRQYSFAEHALTRAQQLAPQSGEILVELAKANFFNHGQHLTPTLEKSLTNVLESLPEPVDALNLLAVNAYRRKDYPQAVVFWQRALALVPPDSPDSRALLNMISQAQQQEGDKNGG